MPTRIEQTQFDTDLGRAAWAVREEVFIREQNVPAEIELDEHDAGAVHLVCLVDEQVVGTLRIVRLADGRAKIGRVAVTKARRKKGHGRQLMLAALDQLRGQVREIVLTSQTEVIGFYEKLGFVATGPVFDEAGIPHRKMTLTFPAAHATPRIDAAFPGGNILVDAIDGDTVYLRQDVRTTTEWWFYFHFRVAGAAGRTIRFQFTNWDPFAATGPCCSDDGQMWRWLGRAAVVHNGFSYTFGPEAKETYFALSFPYVEKHLRSFLATRPRINLRTLTQSAAGREVELLQLNAAAPKATIALVARQHCCEMMANFVLEGLMDFWLQDTSADGLYLREHVSLLAVPFADKDGTEAGDQGKLRWPHDHNRDWSDAPRYAETRALQALFQKESPRMVVDLHCPWIRGGRNEELFFVEGPEPFGTRVRDFAALVEKTQTGPLHFCAANNIGHGVEWNVGNPTTLHQWTDNHIKSSDFALTIETPYGLAGGQVVTPDGARGFGADLARAMGRYLREG